MFGYKLVRHKDQVYKIAEIEKALIDYFYIKPFLKSDGDFEELRIDKETFFEEVNIEKLNKYLEACGSKALSRRVRKFVRYMKNA